LLADTLGGDRAELDVVPLSALVLRKTHGNPFFLNQFVTDLHAKGLLAWNPESRRWTWSLERIEGATATENVIDFMIAKLRRLGGGPRRVLSLAWCIGHEFDRRTLALVAGQPTGEVAALLWEALREGLIVPLDANQGYLHDGAEALGGEPGA